MNPTFNRIVDGPYVGRYIVNRPGDAKLHGIRDGKRWSRLPYFGHVWREGARWVASEPGGYTHVGGFATRHDAGSFLLELGRSA